MNIIKVIVAGSSLVISGPLVQDGWLRSYIEKQSVDASGQPIPWITYPAFDFLRVRLPMLESVFEYGSGNGTRWWATRAAQVRAVENDFHWYEAMKGLVPANVELFYEDLDNGCGYEDKVLTDDRDYDLIVVDGRRRNKCIKQALKRIKARGILVLDNSDREEYSVGIQELVASGFRQIEFSGFCPIVNFKSQTSIFYREDNILQI